MTQPATRVHLPNPRLLKAAWEDETLRHLKYGHLLVLLALVFHTRRTTDTVWPSIERLSKMTRLGARHVKRVLEDLENGGIIKRSWRGRGRVYRMGAVLHAAADRTGAMHGPDDVDTGAVDSTSHVPQATRTGAVDGLRRSKEHRQGSITPGDELEGWEDFWASYPRKVSKKDALKAFRETRKVRPPTAQLLAALRVFTGSKEWQKEAGQYVPYPATWLRDERWRDVEAPAELEAAAGRSIPSEQDWRAALAALAAEKYPDADPAIFRRWEDLPGSLQAEVREVMAGAPADWRHLLRVFLVMNNYDPTRTFESWDRVPGDIRADLRALAAEMEQTPAPEGWAAVIEMLRAEGELPAGDAFEAWSAVPLGTRAQVCLVLEKAEEEQNETKGGNKHAEHNDD